MLDQQIKSVLAIEEIALMIDPTPFYDVILKNSQSGVSLGHGKYCVVTHLCSKKFCN